MRRRLAELAPSTVAAYRHKVRKLWLKVQAEEATDTDRLELAELENLLGVRGCEIPPPGRPRKWAVRFQSDSDDARRSERPTSQPA